MDYPSRSLVQLSYSSLVETKRAIPKKQNNSPTSPMTQRDFFSAKAPAATLAWICMSSHEFPTFGTVYGTTSHISVECSCLVWSPPLPLPTKLPFLATDENREKLEQYILEYYWSSTFNTCEHQPLPLMSGPSVKLMINEDAEPTVFLSPIPVPIHWQDQVKADLDRDDCFGVIEPVLIGEPVTWCQGMVVCAKKNGTPWQIVDFQPLNTHVTRETHHTQSPYHQVWSVPPSSKKTVSDAWNGYHSVPLYEEDCHITTFITDVIDIAHFLWGILLWETAIRAVLTRSYPISPIKSRWSTMCYYGPTPSRRASTKPVNGLTYVKGTE